MSHSCSIPEPVRAGSILASCQSRLANCTTTVGLWLSRRQGRHDLSALDDRLLNDVGISREEAAWKAGRPFRAIQAVLAALVLH